MATFPLVAIVKQDTRKNGEISYIDARILVDGTPAVVNFRAKVGEPAIVVDGDTITVSDELAAAKLDAVRTRLAEVADRDAAQDAQIARFGTLPEIEADSPAQRAYAEDRRRAKLPLIAATLDQGAAKFGTDPDKLARAFAHVASQTSARFWIDTATEHGSSSYVGKRLWADLWYHFA